jgi:uncharacterized protein (TIGR03790 family)
MVNVARWISLWLVLTGVARGDDLAQRVLIVYNASEPESKPLADYYAQRRGVPTNQICRLAVRNAEVITRKEFNEQVREPILKFMNDRGLWSQTPATVEDPVFGRLPSLATYDNKITFVALVYGVPLKIEDDPGLTEAGVSTNTPPERRRNDASVDSELTWLPTARMRLSFVVPNPFFRKSPPVFDAPLNNAMVLVARLDGPDPATVRRMIDDSLAVERTGLLGRAYFDARDIHTAGFEEGDKWIKEAARIVEAAGFETTLDNRPELFGENFPMTDAAIYTGWWAGSVTGALARADFQFRPGAVAYHLHSFSAWSLHTRTGYWVGPLLARGAAASLGHVYEPYLGLTPHVEVLFQRLLNGATFAEAGWYSQPALSWQTTFVGDPLYRPFAVPVDKQIARLEADKNPDVAWAYLRKINILAATGQSADAEALCRAKAKDLSSAVLYEKLGDLLARAGRKPEAVNAYLFALGKAPAARQSVLQDKLAALRPAPAKKN